MKLKPFQLKIIALLGMCLALPGGAQDEVTDLPDAPPAATEEPKSAPKKIVEPKPAVGELRMDGKVTMINGKGSFNIEAQSFTTAQGKTVTLETAKPKTITTDASTRFYPRGDDKAKMSMSDVKLGTRVTIVGKDLGSGKDLPAREIMLWVDLGDNKTIGTVQVSYPVLLLLNSGDNQMTAKNYEEALRIFNRAQGAGASAGDRSGQALSLNRIGSVYSHTAQYEKAIEAYNRALGIWRSVGDTDSQALELNNVAMAYANSDQTDKALESMESAVSMVQNSSDKKLRTLTWINMGGIYLRVDKYELAMNAYERALPLVRGQTDRSEEGRVLARLALASARSSQADKANEYLDSASSATGAMRDKSARAEALQILGLTAHSLDQKDKAQDFFNRAIAAYQEIGDASSIAETQRYLAELNGQQTGEQTTTEEFVGEENVEDNGDGN